MGLNNENSAITPTLKEKYQYKGKVVYLDIMMQSSKLKPAIVIPDVPLMLIETLH